MLAAVLLKSKVASESDVKDVQKGWGGKWLVQTGIGELFMKVRMALASPCFNNFLICYFFCFVSIQ